MVGKREKGKEKEKESSPIKHLFCVGEALYISHGCINASGVVDCLRSSQMLYTWNQKNSSRRDLSMSYWKLKGGNCVALHYQRVKITRDTRVNRHG